ncbi:NAD-dependent epimerase/dehydratase family protein [Elusimicrobiota bacterium]
MPRPKTLAIAGVSGFVGRALAHRLREDWRVVGLTRAADDSLRDLGIELRRCDLFSLRECEYGLRGVDTAFYLVHSMLPSAHLTQGEFQDLDLLMADNFARAAAESGVRHIIYLGGLVPDEPDLSWHLRSRLEVEVTLGSRGVPVTSLRSGLIIGRGGSSFAMLESLVKGLPAIPCPDWTRSRTQPIALEDVIELLRFCLENPEDTMGASDIGCPDVLTYRELMQRTAEALGLRRLFFSVPVKAMAWCRFWVHIVTGVPKTLAGPLMESMRHSMVARDRDLQERAGIPGIPFREAVRTALSRRKGLTITTAWRGRPRRRLDRMGYDHDVRSVQRMKLPKGKSARWAAEQYAAWLPVFFRMIFRVKTDARRNVTIFPPLLSIPLLELEFSEDRSSGSDRQLFLISGGLLARLTWRMTARPRLEFREVLSGEVLLVAIHDYRPTIPWPIYNLTQALVHVWVMGHFAKRISAEAKRGDPSIES